MTQCLGHEGACKKYLARKNYYQSRLINIDDDKHIFFPQSEEDIENCFSSLFSFPHIDDYRYESFEYPCLVVLTEYEATVPYEELTEPYLSVELLDDYISNLQEQVQALLKIKEDKTKALD